MAALMCADIDLNSNAEETEEVVDGISHQNGTKLSIFEAMESEFMVQKRMEMVQSGGWSLTLMMTLSCPLIYLVDFQCDGLFFFFLSWLLL